MGVDGEVNWVMVCFVVLAVVVVSLSFCSRVPEFLLVLPYMPSPTMTWEGGIRRPRRWGKGDWSDCLTPSM
jgi:hypothetical protein